jgi:hypothetical protein
MVQQHVESSGRSFSSDEINLIRQTVKTFSNISLTELSKTLCELLVTNFLKYLDQALRVLATDFIVRSDWDFRK